MHFSRFETKVHRKISGFTTDENVSRLEYYTFSEELRCLYTILGLVMIFKHRRIRCPRQINMVER